MSKVSSENERETHLGRIQAIVAEDFERIESTQEPLTILNLGNNASADEIRDRYQRYEKFYRRENFQRLGDPELVSRAMKVREAIGRAVMDLQTDIEKPDESFSEAPTMQTESLAKRPSVDSDEAALGDIYFRDGLTYLRLGDFHAAEEHLRRAREYDPSRGIILANLAYTRFKIDPTNPEVAELTGTDLEQAALLEPTNPEIFALLARYGINTRDTARAHRAIRELERLRPEHPGLRRLKKRALFP